MSYKRVERGGVETSISLQSAIWCIAVLILFRPLPAATGESATGSQPKEKELLWSADTVKQDLRPITFEAPPVYSNRIREYFAHYGLDVPGVDHFFGTFVTNGFTLAAHVFRPPAYRSTVILMHGYYDHTGILKNLIHELIHNGFAVAVYDMPGHGLSDGERASIDDFSSYLSVFNDFDSLCRQHLHGPFHLVCHSTGSVACLNVLLLTGKPVFERVVFLAPLVRSRYWNLSKVGFYMAKELLVSVPRVFRDNSSDETFRDFLQFRDPLQPRTVPMQWARAFFSWSENIQKAASSAKPVKLIQGTGDTTLDWEHNVAFFTRKFENIEITLVKDGRHQLLNESSGIRQRVLEEIVGYLER